MGAIREAAPAGLFMAVMHRPAFDPAPLLAQLAGGFGPIETRCAPYSFGSGYYEAEMGPGLLKFLVSFARTLPQEALAAVKRETNSLEGRGADGAGRRFNLDPGIVTHYSVVLATTKGYAHRVYLGGGVYAEPALLFRRGSVEPLPWTYPDYQTPAAHRFFSEARRLLMERAAAGGGARPG